MTKIKGIQAERTPWKRSDLKKANIVATKEELLRQRVHDLISHSRYIRDSEIIIEARDKQMDPGDIDNYKIASYNNGAPNSFYDGLDSDDTLTGSAGIDFLKGNNGNDRIYGYSGNDFVDGGKGLDTLTGGEGQDYFRIEVDPTVLTAEADIIEDFSSTEGDTIVLAIISRSPQGINASQNERVVTQDRIETNKSLKNGASFIYEQSSGCLFANSSLFQQSADLSLVLLATLTTAPSLVPEVMLVTT